MTFSTTTKLLYSAFVQNQRILTNIFTLNWKKSLSFTQKGTIHVELSPVEQSMYDWGMKIHSPVDWKMYGQECLLLFFSCVSFTAHVRSISFLLIQCVSVFPSHSCAPPSIYFYTIWSVCVWVEEVIFSVRRCKLCFWYMWNDG